MPDCFQGFIASQERRPSFNKTEESLAEAKKAEGQRQKRCRDKKSKCLKVLQRQKRQKGRTGSGIAEGRRSNAEGLIEAEKAEGQQRKQRRSRRSNAEKAYRSREDRRAAPEAVLQKAEEANAEGLIEGLPRIKRR